MTPCNVLAVSAQHVEGVGYAIFLMRANDKRLRRYFCTCARRDKLERPDVASITVNLGSGGDLVHVSGSAPGAPTTINLGNGDNQCLIAGSGLGQGSTNIFSGGTGNDLFSISAVPTNVTSITILGGPQTIADEIIYTSGTATGANPGNGTLVPTNPNAHSIAYNSIELFSIDNTIFFDGFE